MRHRSLFSILTVALLMATLAAPQVRAQQGDDDQRPQRGEDGQRRGGRGPGGFGGGPGGFGGGFGGGSNPTFLLRVDAVRTELKVTEDQQELISILNDELRESRPEFGDFRNFREMSEEERAELRDKMAKASAEQAAQAKETLKTILDESQYKRLMEIQLQNQGVNALLDDEVVAALKLTPEQVTKLKETQEANGEATRTAMRDAFQGGRDGADRDAMREKMETLRKESEAKMLANLTADQQAQFTAMKGEPFEMPRDAFGFGRGGRGRRGGGDGDRPDRPERPE